MLYSHYNNYNSFSFTKRPSLKTNTSLIPEMCCWCIRQTGQSHSNSSSASESSKCKLSASSPSSQSSHEDSSAFLCKHYTITHKYIMHTFSQFHYICTLHIAHTRLLRTEFQLESWIRHTTPLHLHYIPTHRASNLATQRTQRPPAMNTCTPWLPAFNSISIIIFFHIQFWYLRCCGCPGLWGRQHLARNLL